MRQENVAQEEIQNNAAAYERFVDSQPILNMLELLAKTGRDNFHENGALQFIII